jgi:membrane protein implicated in regulation of membrane protease activity
MVLLGAILLAILVVPSPWQAPVIGAAGAWEAAEVYFWIRWSRRRRNRVGTDTLLGVQARVTSRLDPEGQVQIAGELWAARSTSVEPVPTGATVRILAVDGLTLTVEPD